MHAESTPTPAPRATPPNPTQARPTGALAELVRGLTRPSLTALLVAVATVAGSFFAVASPYAIAADTYLYFEAYPQTYYTYVTARVLERRRGAPAAPEVVLLGGSSVGTCVTSEDELAEEVESRTGIRPVVYDFSAASMTTWEMAGVLGELDDFDGVVLVGLSPYTLADGIDENLMGRKPLGALVDEPRFGFRSDVLDEETRRAGFDPPPRTGIYAIDNFEFFVARGSVLLGNLRDGLDRFDRPMHMAQRPFGYAYWDVLESSIERLSEALEANAPMHLAVIQRMAERCPRAAFTVLVPPLHPRQLRSPATAAFFDRYRERLLRFATEHGMGLLDVTEEAELLDADFIDPGHLRLPSAKARTTSVLAERIAVALAATEDGP
jgi:hypothetical protein